MLREQLVQHIAHFIVLVIDNEGDAVHVLCRLKNCKVVTLCMPTIGIKEMDVKISFVQQATRLRCLVFWSKIGYTSFRLRCPCFNDFSPFEPLQRERGA